MAVTAEDAAQLDQVITGWGNALSDIVDDYRRKASQHGHHEAVLSIRNALRDGQGEYGGWDRDVLSTAVAVAVVLLSATDIRTQATVVRPLPPRSAGHGRPVIQQGPHKPVA
ncbi:hypothetical protein ACFQ1S_02325 [Kibdelosporangium lantanae]|uniref:Uncharacterized protein n=1 Tax=Kibdelosporangium lantanae TaxID=1497396 RepID=A0ABW3M1G0_9PSEU